MEHDDEEGSSQDEAWVRARIAGEAAEREATAHRIVALPTTPDGGKAEVCSVVDHFVKESEGPGSGGPCSEQSSLHQMSGVRRPLL